MAAVAMGSCEDLVLLGLGVGCALLGLLLDRVRILVLLRAPERVGTLRDDVDFEVCARD